MCCELSGLSRTQNERELLQSEMISAVTKSHMEQQCNAGAVPFLTAGMEVAQSRFAHTVQAACWYCGTHFWKGNVLGNLLPYP